MSSADSAAGAAAEEDGKVLEMGRQIQGDGQGKRLGYTSSIDFH